MACKRAFVPYPFPDSHATTDLIMPFLAPFALVCFRTFAFYDAIIFFFSRERAAESMSEHFVASEMENVLQFFRARNYTAIKLTLE